jgi:hypothetical protein
LEPRVIPRQLQNSRDWRAKPKAKPTTGKSLGARHLKDTTIACRFLGPSSD